jgi:transcriptional regulator with XRE-family HTH domain
MPRPARELTPELSARHLFGAKLRRAREDRGWSLEVMAGKVTTSKSHLARIETAEYMPPPELPAQLDELFDTGIFAELYALCKKEAHPDKYRRRMELEAQAVIIREYSPSIVPGILQTEDYAKAQFRSFNPKATEGDIEELWTLRLGRQALLLGDPRPDYAVILDEAVLRRSYGGPGVMRDQLERLADLALTPTSFVQVLPFSHGGHALAGGSLALWTLNSGQHVAYEESISSGTLFEERDEVLGKMRAYDLLTASALSPLESADLIRSVMEALPR